MTSSQPPNKPQTQIGQIISQATQVFQNALAIKPGAKVAELWVQEANAPNAKVHKLLGDRYFLGRSSQDADIVVPNPVVSKKHLSLTRDSKRPRKFIIRDEHSTNGIYLGRKRLKSMVLRHGDILTLGPPELKDAVRVQFHNPPPLIIFILRYALYGLGGLSGLIVLWIAIAWAKYPVGRIPPGVQGPVVVYSRDNQPLRELRNDAHRELKRLKDFSPHLPKALLASEDSRYYWHFGVDPLGIARAIVRGFGGGSTLTQQVARSLFPEVGRENTIDRKIREMIVAFKMEAFYSKDKIIKTYLNRVYLGVDSYGFEDAAQFYFDKSARDLDISEAATLVAILPAPNSFNPVQDYETAIKLRNRIITRMADQGKISEEDAQRARRSRIEVSPEARRILGNTKAPYFYGYIFRELEELLGEDLAAEGNFVVQTSLDLNAQAQADAALRNGVNGAGSSLGFSQGAIVTLNTRNGEIVAMTGGVDYAQSQFNRAHQAQRQPGSTFKVFAYAAAIEQGFSPGKVYSCAPLNWQGQKYKGCERVGSGSANMYTGLAQSENAIALRVAQDASLDGTIAMARKLGVRSKLEATPGLVLGQSEVNVLEMTGAYATFANNGVWNRPHGIRRVLDSSDCEDDKNPETCRVIYSYDQDSRRGVQAISSGVANTMNSMLRGVISGTGSAAALGKGEAGKTGTTNRNVDMWFIGYVPTAQLVTGVWLGNDNPSPTRGSSAQAARVWANYMRQITQ